MRNWADKWKVISESCKYKVLTISLKRNPKRSALLFRNMPEEDELEILGITVDRKLTWTKHIFNITARARQKLGALRKVANKLNIVGRATLYKVQIYSGMEYASLCWMSAPTTTLNFSTPSTVKHLRITGVNGLQARVDLHIPTLHHRCQAAATTVLYKMHTSLCPPALKRMLPLCQGMRSYMPVSVHDLFRPNMAVVHKSAQ